MFIFSNLATSLDGKIAPADRSFFLLGTPADRLQMQVLRKRADAIVMGASTLRTFRGPLLIRGAKKHPINVVVSRSLEGISPDWPFFTRKDVKRVLFVNRGAPAARLRKFEATSEIVLLDPKKPAAPQMVRALGSIGVKRLLVEGGGGVMWDFVAYGLLDELHVTLTPWIIGGRDAPTLVDGSGFSGKNSQKLRLKRSRRLGDELYLTYQVV
jgi:riboflavin-specific deaminase-like protein